MYDIGTGDDMGMKRNKNALETWIYMNVALLLLKQVWNCKNIKNLLESPPYLLFLQFFQFLSHLDE